MRLGFGSKWSSWMQDKVFKSSMSVSVNGSPSYNFKVTIGPRQGDPVSLLLFSIVTEGLSSLVNNATRDKFFRGYCVNDQVSYNMLQFVDDTLLSGEASWENLW